MPTIKLFESWLEDQSGQATQINEAEPTPASFTAPELAKEAAGKKINEPFVSAKKNTIIVPTVLDNKTGLQFMLYPIGQDPAQQITPYQSTMRSENPVTDSVPTVLDTLETGTGKPKPAFGYNVGTAVDLFLSLKGVQPTLTTDQYLTMLDIARSGYTAELAKAAAANKKLIMVGDPADKQNADKVQLIAAAKAKATPAAPTAPTQPTPPPTAA